MRLYRHGISGSDREDYESCRLVSSMQPPKCVEYPLFEGSSSESPLEALTEASLDPADPWP